ncbi:MAG: ATP-binding protein [Fidelibacterota bacterium]|nr:MAG: ATP-binding protein [Candidatus Neomarinimicrobiota bacterium]
MVFRQFQINLVIRVLILTATIVVAVYLFINKSYITTVILFTGAVLLQVYALIRYVTKTDRDLARFFQAIRYTDFSQSFPDENRGKIHSELTQTLNDIIEAFQRERIEKEEHYLYLQTIVQHIGIALVSFDQDGHVSLINRAAKRLLKVPQLRNIRALDQISPLLLQTLLHLKPGSRDLVKIEINNEPMQLAVHATELRIYGHTYTLASIQNIQSELEKKELEAWQNLIRVLTHEIMNSVTPIASLASTLHGLLPSGKNGLQAEDEGGLGPEELADFRSGIQTIQQRSQGLLHFVDSYRNLTRIPKPDFQIFPIADLFTRVNRLMSEQLSNNSIELSTSIEPTSLELTADTGLIEQVLINLILNAIQALDDRPNPHIDLLAYLNRTGRIIIDVVDNGSGILEDVQEKVFIPFFSTHKQGTGIGLAVCREIMRLHGGSIGVRSKPNIETVFSLRF